MNYYIWKMGNRRTVTLCGNLLFCSLTGLYAQQGTVASGGLATGAGGSVSYSVGIVDYITANGATGSVSQGIQQVYTIKIIDGINEEGITLAAVVYPNPANEFVKLNITGKEGNDLTYQLIDVLGKILIEKKIESNETLISLSGFSDAIYFIKVIGKNKELKTFKIIKTHE
jgi:hypothetical protein